MKKKYYLRGLGLGILVTAIVFGITGSSKMSDEDIIKRAEELGYVKQSAEISPTISIKDLMETGTPTPTLIPTQEPSAPPQETPVPETTETPIPTEAVEVIPIATQAPVLTPTPSLTAAPTATPVITDAPAETTVMATIVIERGNTATVVCNKIQEAGIVESGEELKKYLVNQNLTDYINVGEYKLSSNMSFKEIAYILTGR